ncbi:MAG: desulfoferrodoxin [Crenarchaeota archaeon]|nr:desulfoferrodoxin [Thermoproteota archaeon]
MSIRNYIYGEGNLPDNVREKARTHLPLLECPDKVKEGEILRLRIRVEGHPNRIDHYISSIDVYFSEDDRPFNPVKIAHIELMPEYAEPIIELGLRLRKSGTIHVVAYCTTHGLWESARRIVVEK